MNGNINGQGTVSITNASKILEMSVSIPNSTINPTSNELIIYVDKSSFLTQDRKTYSFSLNTPLQNFNNVSDEFILKDDGITEVYVLRKVNNNQVLDEPIRNNLTYQEIELFEGINYIYTNYEDATIDITYSQNFSNNSSSLTWNDIYFKDAFTEVDGKINVEANNITANCITSKNNKFSLDSDGNLIVNTITTNTDGTSNIDFSTIYPIGSIYLSVVNTNPSTYFGGVWEQISGYYLYAGTVTGTGGSSTSGSASGETGSTTLATNQIPNHLHSIPSLGGYTNATGAHAHNIGADFDGGAGSARYTVHSKGVTGAGYLKATSTDGSHSHSVTTYAANTGATGGGMGHTHTLNNHTHTINPPFYNLFVFKRVS